MDIRVDDILEMKKPHPCGSRRFTVLRVGMDFRLKCDGCGHEVMVPPSENRAPYQKSGPAAGTAVAAVKTLPDHYGKRKAGTNRCLISCMKWKTIRRNYRPAVVIPP